MTQRRRELGAAGEAATAAWYRRSGYRILDTNWRCASGEIDLVAARGRLLVFCEVKTRSTDRFGTAAEAVGPAKQRRLRRLAMAYLAALRADGSSGTWDLRFDVAALRPGPHGFAVEVIEAAF